MDITLITTTEITQPLAMGQGQDSGLSEHLPFCPVFGLQHAHVLGIQRATGQQSDDPFHQEPGLAVLWSLPTPTSTQHPACTISILRKNNLATF